MAIVRFRIGVSIFPPMSTFTLPYILTPTGQRKLLLGANISEHSKVKFLNGKSTHLIFYALTAWYLYTRGTLLSDSLLT
jgi:hypothetical protein